MQVNWLPSQFHVKGKEKGNHSMECIELDDETSDTEYKPSLIRRIALLYEIPFGTSSLYSTSQFLVATVFGSLMAGAILVASNERRKAYRVGFNSLGNQSEFQKIFGLYFLKGCLAMAFGFLATAVQARWVVAYLIGESYGAFVCAISVIALPIFGLMIAYILGFNNFSDNDHFNSYGRQSSLLLLIVVPIGLIVFSVFVFAWQSCLPLSS